MIGNSSDDIVIGLTDLKRLYFKIRPKLWRMVCFCAGLTFLFLLVRQPQYLAQASFKQVPQNSDASSRLKEMFQGVAGATGSETGTSAIMQSRVVLKQVVEELGLQIKESSPFLPLQLLKNAWANLKSEFGGRISDPDPFIFRQVVYQGEKSHLFYLKYVDSRHVELFNRERKSEGFITVGEPFKIGGMQGILEQMPAQIVPNRLYCFTIKPWLEAVEKLRKRLVIKPLKQEKLILGLTYLDWDRNLASRILNQVMDSYQQFMRKENEEIMGYQRSYLEQRQNELTRKWEESLQEHVSYLKNNLDSGGYFSLYQEMEVLAQPRKLFTSKLFDIDLELKRLEGMPMDISLMRDPFNPSKIHSKKEKRNREQSSQSHLEKQVSQRRSEGDKEERDQFVPNYRMMANVLEEKRQQWDRKLFALQLEQERLATSIRPASQLQQEIASLSRQANEALELLEKWEKEQKLFPVHDPNSLVGLWVAEVDRIHKKIAAASSEKQGYLKDKFSSETVRLSDQLKSYIELIQNKKRALEENLLVQQGSMQEFSGLTLETAQTLYITYNTTRDNLQAQLRQLVYLSEELSRPDFELSSITAILSDPVTLNMVETASDTSVQLRDANNRSHREQEHLREALETQKKFIGHHLGQTIELLKLRASLIDDKIFSLQQTTIDLLKQEKKLIEEKLQEISGKMEGLPEKWRRENLLMLKKDLGMHMIGGLTQLAETKNIDQHLFQFGSKALDPSYLPLKPNSPHLFLYSSLSALFAGLLCFFYYLCKGIFRGLPVTHESLLVHGYRSLGSFSFDCNGPIGEMKDQDLETLRKISQFLMASNEKSLCSVLIGGKNPDYSHRLAELLAMQGSKVLLVHYVFDTVSPHHVPGLWQYLQADGLLLPIRHQETYDYLPSGGTGRHGVEMLAHPRFQAFLSEAKSRYDYVLIYSKAKPHFAESQALLRIADLVVVTTWEEKKEDLSLFREWETRKEKPCAAFVCCDGGR